MTATGLAAFADRQQDWPASPLLTHAVPSPRRTYGRGRAGRTVTLLLAVGIATVTGAHPAGAETGVRVGNVQAYARTAPDRSATAITLLPAGTPLTVICQTLGGPVAGIAGRPGTSSIWDRVRLGTGTAYVADLMIDGTPYARRDPRLPDCAQVDRPTAPVQTREQRAHAFALSQIGAAVDEYGRSVHFWCLRWVSTTYGVANSGRVSAIALYNELRARGQIRSGQPTPGALVFFGAAQVNGGYGHVGLADTTPGQMISALDRIRRTPLSAAGAPYLGWSFGPADWPGRR